MHIDPVYLVSPTPTPRARTSRRAFLIGGATFFAGVGIGCGYGQRVDAAAAAAPRDATNRDDVLEELRALATHAPLEDLVDARFRLLHHLERDYPDDVVLWAGVGRLAEACLTMPNFPDRSLAAPWLARRIEQARHPSPSLRALADRLKTLR
ncbi:MAG: hypothetical protein VYA51_08160 [Planctomycetota bacterium]|nr:hypothetical protein [Planctomycetota bacterium]